MVDLSMANCWIDGKWGYQVVIPCFSYNYFTDFYRKKKGISGHDCGPTCGSVFVLCMRLCHVALLKLSNYSMTAKYWANGGTPKSSILIYGIFHDKLTFWGTSIYGNPHMFLFRNLFQVYALLISAGLLETSLFIDYFFVIQLAFPKTCLVKKRNDIARMKLHW